MSAFSNYFFVFFNFRGLQGYFAFPFPFPCVAISFFDVVDFGDESFFGGIGLLFTEDGVLSVVGDSCLLVTFHITDF